MNTVQDSYGNAITTRVNKDEVQVVADGETRADYTPAQARELAAALLRAADEAEGV
ncbi:hypothetical protein [Streptomyces sp. SID5910]|uniref:hypothetical protein n=1 Tax=Streptomyces sp. SID5910 TaxID=2690312 RepID=UPI00136969B1|nr:hypothetical protein [Streptomyces sp. SID5910]MYR43125.1 hypothetical protein [Streptomyces sp. SID5910]